MSPKKCIILLFTVCFIRQKFSRVHLSAGSSPVHLIFSSKYLKIKKTASDSRLETVPVTKAGHKDVNSLTVTVDS